MLYCLIDRVIAIQANEWVRGIKNVTVNEEVLTRHFPDYPVYPGTMVVEAAAQLSGFLLEYSLNQPDELPERAVLMQIERAKFYKGMQPGDQLLITCEINSVIARAAKVSCSVNVSDTATAAMELQFKMFPVQLETIHQQQREIYREWTRGLQLDRPIP